MTSTPQSKQVWVTNLATLLLGNIIIMLLRTSHSQHRPHSPQMEELLLLIGNRGKGIRARCKEQPHLG